MQRIPDYDSSHILMAGVYSFPSRTLVQAAARRWATFEERSGLADIEHILMMHPLAMER